VQRLPNARRSVARLRKDAKHQAARIKRLDVLADLIGDLRMGETWHIMTSGDLDAGNVLDFLVQRHGPFGRLYLSTWSMERQHVNILEEHLAAGQFAGFTVLTGDYFAQREPANYTRLVDLAERFGGAVYRFNNHSKLIALRRRDETFSAVVEGSANFTRNPRVENCCITCDHGLYDHVVPWFDELTEHRDEYRFLRP
jgi:hypothetical protein